MLVMVIATSFFQVAFADMGAIGSKGALKQYALKQITAGEMWVFTRFGNNFSVSVEGNTPSEIVDKLMRTKIELSSPRAEMEVVSVWVILRDNDWNQYFNTYQELAVIQTKGKWMLDKATLTLKMNDYIPVKVPEGLEPEGVAVTLRTEDGYYAGGPHTWLNNNVFYFPTAYAGSFGEVVFTTGEKQVIYDLQTGESLDSESFEGYLHTLIETYREYSLYGDWSDNWHFALVDKNGVMVSAPVYRLDVRSKSTFMVDSYVYYQQEYGGWVAEMPVRAFLEDLNGSVTEVFPDSNGRIIVRLSEGTYFLRLEFESIERPTPPFFEGGKG